MRLAVTGGTGFVGSHFIDAALAAGHEVRALTRRPREPRPNIQWIGGALEDPDSLRQLVQDSDAVIHIAAVITGRKAADFEPGNVTGTLTMLAAATAAGTQRFIHVSSLAAREPELSLYGGSKAKGEALVKSSGLNWAIVRPPAVYGPGDRETLELFRIARTGLMLLPPEGRASMIHVSDLVALLLTLATRDEPKQVIFEPDDGLAGGWPHKQMAAAIGEAVGRRNVALPMPRSILRLGAAADELFRRDRAKLTRDRAAYFTHSDWVANPALRPAPDLWSPRIQTREGLAETARWYREQGWL